MVTEQCWLWVHNNMERTTCIIKRDLPATANITSYNNQCYSFIELYLKSIQMAWTHPCPLPNSIFAKPPLNMIANYWFSAEVLYGQLISHVSQHYFWIKILSKLYVLSIFLSVFVAGTLFPISPGWRSLPFLSSLLSQIKIPSLLFSAFSPSLAGLKTHFRTEVNRIIHSHSDLVAERLSLTLSSHCFRWSGSALHWGPDCQIQEKPIHLKPDKGGDSYNIWHRRWLSPCCSPETPDFCGFAFW